MKLVSYRIAEIPRLKLMQQLGIRLKVKDPWYLDKHINARLDHIIDVLQNLHETF